jgi:drug/metabolite transporter (DMT)-like permease
VSRVALGTLLVAVGAALFGTLSYLARNASAAGLDALPFVAWRALIGTATLFVLGLAFARRAGGGRRWPDIRILPRDRRRALVLVAAAGAVLNIAMFAAILRTAIAVALISFYTFPAIVTLAAVPLFGERLDRTRLGALLLSVTGLALVVLSPVLFPVAGSGGANIVVDPVGVALALVAAVCQAFFILVSARGWKPMATLHVSTFVVSGAAVAAIPLALLAGQGAALTLPLHDATPWPWILAAGITGAAVPTTIFIAGIGMIGASRAAILMTIEPLVGVSSAALLLGEQPTVLQLVGGAAVLVAAAILQVAPRAPVPSEPETGPLV